MKLHVLGLLFLVWMLCFLPSPGLKYSDRWVVQVKAAASANQIAGRHDMQNLGQVMKDHDYYTFQQTNFAQDPSDNLRRDVEVLWFEHEEVLQIASRGGGGGGEETPSINAGGRSEGLQLNDTKWLDGMQWYLDKSSQGSLPTMNVRAAWEQCVRGGGVTVAVVDDGIFYENEDLQDRVDLEASYDVYTNKNDPKPQSEDYDHGTKVAGIIGAEANGFCGVGAAFNVTLAGIRLLGGEITDDLIATALTKTKDKTDVYVNSWGPVMDGTMLGIVGAVTQKALETTSKEGRQGKGSIFVWAGGNGGGTIGDSCAYDGYVNSRYTIAINGATRFGKHLATGESCSAIMATAYSKDEKSRDPIVTTTGLDGCTNDFGKSSAAAAFGGGIISLALQANPALTWRDIQHLITMTSLAVEKFEPNDWITNKANNKVSPTFGFGLLDAGKLVRYAKDWKSVEPAIMCEEETTFPKKTAVGVHEIEIGIASCKSGNITYLEHVEVSFSLNYTARGYLAATLTSPSGTVSGIVPGRRKDTTETQFDWSVTSVHFWGEAGDGKWKVEFRDAFSDLKGEGMISSLKLTLYGTQANPRAGQNTSYTVVNNGEAACPVLAPFERILGEMDFTPLYIFIALIIIIAISLIGYFVWKKKLRNQKKCGMCGPKYQVAKEHDRQV
ncbi:proprotein convertase subtilisin/kexin type 6-like [Lineus longissimus]|uniref:proprotein convertase subtilisin/kexin type 6-like n=1 Tax=Lineus longissimus TaxID=88925 RepID=UPI002B4C34A3